LQSIAPARSPKSVSPGASAKKKQTGDRAVDALFGVERREAIASCFPVF
jgi:hypothetical protein